MKVLFFMLMLIFCKKQFQWQKMKKIDSIRRGHPQWLMDYWLSCDPNHFCADLNSDKKINFFDYALYLKMKGL
jgi:hypothetical protein